MKQTIILAVTALAAAGIVLSGCSISSSETLPLQGPAIVLHAGIKSVATTLETDNTFMASIAGWESASTPQYDAACTWQSTFTTQTATLPQPITLAPEAYYNANIAVSTWMKAWHPQGTLGADNKVTFAGEPDGTADVILATGVRGNREDVAAKNLEFRHLLTQLRFKVKAAKDLLVKPTLSSITVHGVQLPLGLDLATDAAIYASAADYTIKGITPGQLVFTPTAQGAGTPLLLRPFDGNTFRVDITTSKGVHSDVTATIEDDAQFLPGKAYTITLTYTGRDAEPLEVTVSVAPWQDIEGGDSEIPMRSQTLISGYSIYNQKQN